jgi:glycosyltransferase involved in cell wall biosynthesis
MKSKNNQPIVLVLGMHRSGTSALTKSLELLGVNLGTELHQPRYDNPKGFWEDKDCVAINDELLSYFSSSWDDLYLEDTSKLQSPKIEELRIRARELLKTRVSTLGLWGFKDPRSSRLVPFWKLVLQDLNYFPLFVIAVRNPLSVAASLTKRDQLPIERSIYLWQQHNLSALTETFGEKRLVVDYDQLLADPIQQISRMAKNLELQMPAIDSENLQSYCRIFLEEGLRHSSFSVKSLLDHPSVSPDAVSLYELLTKASADDISLDDPKIIAILETLKLNLKNTKPAFKFISSLEKARAQDSARNTELQNSLSFTKNQLDVAQADLKSLALANSGNTLEIAQLRDSLDTKTKEIATTIKNYNNQLTSIQSKYEALSAANSSLKTSLEKTEADFSELKNQKSFWTTHFNNYQRAAKLAEDKLAQKIQEMDLVEKQLRELSHKYSEHSALAEKHSLRAIELETQLEKIRDTLSLEINNLSSKLTSLEAELQNQLQEKHQLSISQDKIAYTIKTQIAEFTGRIQNLTAAYDKLEDEKSKLQEALSVSQYENDTLRERLLRQEKSLLDLSNAFNEIAKDRETLARQEAQHIANINELQNEVNMLHQIATEKQTVINQMANSKSWKITKPFRNTIDISRNIKKASIISGRRTALALWQKAPISRNTKDKIRDLAFSSAPSLFRNTNRYSNWQSARELANRVTGISNETSINVDNFTKITKAGEYTTASTKLIAFYLPQFHPIPENNSWWGEGFTEWTNVQPAQPQFEGHYQPRIPGELGYYNLLDGQTQKRQVELAKLYGIGGFCFYMYWFGGKRLLEKPLDNYLNDQTLDLPFCVCWANENWSRRWDGLDKEILISQEHSPEDDLAFIAEAAKYLRDPRYIRIAGAPLLMIYRPALFPNIKETVERWRNWCRENSVGEIHLAYTQSFESVDPKEYGFDSAIEFPPNNACPPNLSNQITPLSNECRSTVYDWRHYVNKSFSYTEPGYSLFRSVCPSWDNTARRKGNGTVFLNSSPSQYQTWLQNAITHTKSTRQKEDEQLVFINAWNEWAEGAYLEPDQRYGYAYLQATKNALVATGLNAGSVLIVTHDCHPHGAQFLILETAKIYKEMGFQVFIVTLKGGILLPEFSKVGMTLDLDSSSHPDLLAFLSSAKSLGTRDVITSTVVSGSLIPTLSNMGFRIISLIHELPELIRRYKQEQNAETIARLADKIVFPAQLVADQFGQFAEISPEKLVIRPQGLLRQNPYKNKKAEARQLVASKLGIPTDSKIVLGIGYVDSRKGPDLFVEAASQVLLLEPDTFFIWVGHAEKEMEAKVRSRISELGLECQILFVGFDAAPFAYYAAADVYALTSREDPFPNVVVEATEVDVPVVAFSGASGAEEFILRNGGKIAPQFNTEEYAAELVGLLNQTEFKSKEKVGSLREYALDLLHHLNGFIRVSAIVPNYNYKKYLASRIQSLVNQTYPIYQLIILDDASTDNSCEFLKDLAQSLKINPTLHINQTNSGSVFKQWSKGIELSKGDAIWIAEADDLAEDQLLKELAPDFLNPEIVLSYCESKQIDENGRLLANNYLEYTRSVSESFEKDYCVQGKEEISRALAIKNTIPNVSGVVFRKTTLQSIFEKYRPEIEQLTIAGDWLIYLQILKFGKIKHSKKNFNLHRRHSSSVTQSTMLQRHLREVAQMQNLASQIVVVPDETKKAAKQYLQVLITQFNLDPQELKDVIN